MSLKLQKSRLHICNVKAYAIKSLLQFLKYFSINILSEDNPKHWILIRSVTHSYHGDGLTFMHLNFATHQGEEFFNSKILLWKLDFQFNV